MRQKTSSIARERGHLVIVEFPLAQGMQVAQADKGSNWNHARAGAGGGARFVLPLWLRPTMLLLLASCSDPHDWGIKAARQPVNNMTVIHMVPASATLPKGYCTISSISLQPVSMDRLPMCPSEYCEVTCGE